MIVQAIPDARPVLTAPDHVGPVHIPRAAGERHDRKVEPDRTPTVNGTRPLAGPCRSG